MESTAKRRLALFGGGVLLAASVTTLVQVVLLGGNVTDAEPYAVAIGLGVGIPMLLAGAYPVTSVDSSRTRATLALAESTIGTASGVGAVALLLALDVGTMLTVGGGAAAAYLGAVAARAVVLGRLAVDRE